MTLSNERNTSLAFDTVALREYGKRYGNIADDLISMADKLQSCLDDLNKSGWTTPAGSAFNKMVNANWKDNIKKYADLLNTLQGILEAAASEYDDLVDNHIEKTKLL